MQQITPSNAVPAAFTPPPIQLVQPPPTRDHRQSSERTQRAPTVIGSYAPITGANPFGGARSALAGNIVEA
eukprot:13031608-Alexandrium_andersonii.AAC.1